MFRLDFAGGGQVDFDGAGAYTPPGGTIAIVETATLSWEAGKEIWFIVHNTDGSTTKTTSTVGSITLSSNPGTSIDWIDMYANDASGNNKLNIPNLGVRSEVVNHNLTFTVVLSDDDGDTVTSDQFSVQVVNDGTPYTTAPIALDLDGNGVEFLPISAGVTHDYGLGLVGTAWVGANDGLLARQTATGLDIVFTDDAPGANTDLEGLAKAHDSNGDGKFDANDATFGEFGVWQDANSDGVVDAGEFRVLAEAGISAIMLTSDGKAYTTANGDVQVHGEGIYVRADGSKGTLADVSFAVSAERASNRGLEFASLAAAAGALSALTAPVLLVSDSGESDAGTDASSFADAPPTAITVDDAEGSTADIVAALQANLVRPDVSSDSSAPDDADGDAAGLQDAGSADGFAPGDAGSDGGDNPAFAPVASLFTNDAGGIEAMHALLSIGQGAPAPQTTEPPADLGAL